MPQERPHLNSAESHYSDAFRHEYAPNVHPESLRDDIRSYLGEYRFAVPEYVYNLAFHDGKLRDIHDREPLTTKGERAIEKRKSEWKNTSREEAELIGMRLLEQQLANSHRGDRIVWASPPGPEEDGYGDYGFVFVGTLESNGEPREKQLSMTAYRVENPTIKQYNRLFKSVDSNNKELTTAEEFLMSPRVFSSGAMPELPLREVFSFRDSGVKNRAFEHAWRTLSENVDEFITLVKSGVDKANVRNAFFAIENYAIVLRDWYADPHRTSKSKNIAVFSLDSLMSRFDYQPPAVAGSCGSTTSFKNNIFQSTSALRSILERSKENFRCPSCQKESTPPVGDSCPKCHITKDEAAEQGLITC